MSSGGTHNGALKRNLGVTGLTALASSATLVCCVLPAVLISVGAGAVLASLVSEFPQLIWLSRHKGLVFGFAGVMLAISVVLLRWQRTLPCPADPVAGRQCARLRRLSTALFCFAVLAYLTGAFFAFVLPRL
jgi:hypothetical protein